MSHVAWSLCLYMSVCWAHRCKLCKNGWTDHEPVWGLTHVGPRSHVLDGVKIRPYKDAILRSCPTHWKALEVSAEVYAAKGIIQPSTRAWQRDCCNRLQWSWLIGVTLHGPREKFAHCDAAFRRNSLTSCYTINIQCLIPPLEVLTTFWE